MKPSISSVKSEIKRRLPLFARIYEDALVDHEVVVLVRTADDNLMGTEVANECGSDASGYALTQTVSFFTENWDVLGDANGGDRRWGGTGSTSGETVGDALARLAAAEECPYWIVDHVQESSCATGHEGSHVLTIYKPQLHEGVRTHRLLLVQRESLARNLVHSMLEE